MQQQKRIDPDTVDSEIYFKLLFDKMLLPFILTEYKSGKIIKVNDCFCTIFEHSPIDLIGNNTINLGFWNNSNRQLFTNELNEYNSVNGLELTVQKKSGETINVLLYANLIVFNAEKYVFTSVIDITKRKQTEEALRLSEEKFRSIFDNNAAATAIFSLDTTIAEVNDAYCKVSGYEREEVVGMSWTQQIPPDEIERLMEYNRKRLLNPDDAPSEYEFAFNNKQGDRKYGHMSVSLLPESKIIITSFVDTTLRKNAELLLAKQSEELKELVAFKNNELTYNILQLSNNNELYLELNKKLKELKKQIKSENSKFLGDIDDIIDYTEQKQQPFNWNKLKEHLMVTRPTFLANIVSKHPALTPAEIKLCALLSLNIDTKEIASISKLTYDSVRVSRTRLRKKLGLESQNENSLIAYLLKF